MANYKYDLEERLIKFSVDVIALCNVMGESFAARHLAEQLIRSSTSVALNYGEAQSAQSPKDFIHKMRLCLKELRESYVNLKIQKEANLIKNSEKVDILIEENSQLIAIFVSSIKTSKRKNHN
ncbi:MAG: four helix bundle protein [Bacteroidota bacterium]